jgi:hypothetical protein
MIVGFMQKDIAGFRAVDHQGGATPWILIVRF